jgi:hypothetical protein
LVEEYVTGRQFSVATIMGKALPLLEVAQLNTRDTDSDINLLGK